MLGALVTLGLLALAAGTTSVTLGRAVVTLRPRRWLEARLPRVAEAVDCLYCSSHWTAAAAVAAARPDVLPGCHPAISLTVAWLAVVALAAPAMLMINRAHAAMSWE